MNCCILYRTNGGKLEYVSHPAGWIYEFPHMDAAIEYVEKNSELLRNEQITYQIVELDEL